eukprot:m.37746 g.37746  ORF g.37746 m.37746 type:complete len:1817 (+) comp32442_c0_seq2:33-5483(+)
MKSIVWIYSWLCINSFLWERSISTTPPVPTQTQSATTKLSPTTRSAAATTQAATTAESTTVAVTTGPAMSTSKAPTPSLASTAQDVVTTSAGTTEAVTTSGVTTQSPTAVKITATAFTAKSTTVVATAGESTTTKAPTTVKSSTQAPTTAQATSQVPTTTMSVASTQAATTKVPTATPTTSKTTTKAPTTVRSSTQVPTTAQATTQVPTTVGSTTKASTTTPVAATMQAATTQVPTTVKTSAQVATSTTSTPEITAKSTTLVPTTVASSTEVPTTTTVYTPTQATTTVKTITQGPTTVETPTTQVPSTANTSTVAATSQFVTAISTTRAPTTATKSATTQPLTASATGTASTTAVTASTQAPITTQTPTINVTTTTTTQPQTASATGTASTENTTTAATASTQTPTTTQTPTPQTNATTMVTPTTPLTSTPTAVTTGAPTSATPTKTQATTNTVKPPIRTTQTTPTTAVAGEPPGSSNLGVVIGGAVGGVVVVVLVVILVVFLYYRCRNGSPKGNTTLLSMKRDSSTIVMNPLPAKAIEENVYSDEYRALYSFAGSGPEELNFTEKDIVTVIERSDSGWWKGTVRNGKSGWFPAEYVQESKPVRRPSASGGVTIVKTAEEASRMTLSRQKDPGAAAPAVAIVPTAQDAVKMVSSEQADAIAETSIDVPVNDHVSVPQETAAPLKVEPEISAIEILPTPKPEPPVAEESPPKTTPIEVVVTEKPEDVPVGVPVESAPLPGYAPLETMRPVFSQPESAEKEAYTRLLPTPYASPYAKPGMPRPQSFDALYSASLSDSYPFETSTFEAIYDYAATHTDELTLAVGDRITVVERQDDGWWKGTSADKSGWFPASYVTPVDARSDRDSGIGENEEEGTEYKVVFPFNARRNDELTLKEDDVVLVFETADSGWWRGSVGTREGWFPGSHVEPLIHENITEEANRHSYAEIADFPGKEDTSEKPSQPVKTLDLSEDPSKRPYVDLNSVSTGEKPEKPYLVPVSTGAGFLAELASKMSGGMKDSAASKPKAEPAANKQPFDEKAVSVPKPVESKPEKSLPKATRKAPAPPSAALKPSPEVKEPSPVPSPQQPVVLFSAEDEKPRKTASPKPETTPLNIPKPTEAKKPEIPRRTVKTKLVKLPQGGAVTKRSHTTKQRAPPPTRPLPPPPTRALPPPPKAKLELAEAVRKTINLGAKRPPPRQPREAPSGPKPVVPKRVNSPPAPKIDAAAAAATSKADAQIEVKKTAVDSVASPSAGSTKPEPASRPTAPPKVKPIPEVKPKAVQRPDERDVAPKMGTQLGVETVKPDSAGKPVAPPKAKPMLASKPPSDDVKSPAKNANVGASSFPTKTVTPARPIVPGKATDGVSPAKSEERSKPVAAPKPLPPSKPEVVVQKPPPKPEVAARRTSKPDVLSSPTPKQEEVVQKPPTKPQPAARRPSKPEVVLRPSKPEVVPKPPLKLELPSKPEKLASPPSKPEAVPRPAVKPEAKPRPVPAVKATPSTDAADRSRPHFSPPSAVLPPPPTEGKTRLVPAETAAAVRPRPQPKATKPDERKNEPEETKEPRVLFAAPGVDGGSQPLKSVPSKKATTPKKPVTRAEIAAAMKTAAKQPKVMTDGHKPSKPQTRPRTDDAAGEVQAKTPPTRPKTGPKAKDDGKAKPPPRPSQSPVLTAKATGDKVEDKKSGKKPPPRPNQSPVSRKPDRPATVTKMDNVPLKGVPPKRPESSPVAAATSKGMDPKKPTRPSQPPAGGAKPSRPPPPKKEEKATQRAMKAAATYNAQRPDELTFNEGDIILELEPADSNGWAKGKLASTGKIGIYPSTYVDPM